MRDILDALKKNNIKNVKISLEEIEKLYKVQDYTSLSQLVYELISSEQISPIKSNGQNGKKPALYNMYKVVKKDLIDTELADEMNFKLYPLLNLNYYFNHIEEYKRDRTEILKLSDFLSKNKQLLNKKISMNERSFQIWQREKYLKGGGGKGLLKNLGLTIEFLNIYETSEPIAYYSHYKTTPQNILIIENEDTFYTLREYMLSASNKIFDIPIGTLIYGRGKGIIKSIGDFENSAEPYLLNKENKMLYFGDLDYEGIVIYESFYKRICEKYRVEPFCIGYIKMLELAKNLDLPKSKDGQNKNIADEFLNNFTLENRRLIQDILASGLYIPQEIINTIILEAI